MQASKQLAARQRPSDRPPVTPAPHAPQPHVHIGACSPSPAAQLHVPAATGANSSRPRRRRPAACRAVAAPDATQASPPRPASPAVDSVVRGTVSVLHADGTATITLANGSQATLGSTISQSRTRRKTSSLLSVGEEVVVMVDSNSPLQVSMARLELFPGEAITHRSDLMERASAYLRHSTENPDQEHSYQAWLGQYLLSRFTQGTPEPAPNKSMRRDRLPAWADLRPRMLVRGVVERVLGDIAFLSIPSHRLKSRALLHVSKFSNANLRPQEFVSLLQPGTQVMAVVSKVEEEAIPGTPPKVYLDTQVLETEDGDIITDLASFNDNATASHAAFMKEQAEKQLSWLENQLKKQAQMQADRQPPVVREGTEHLATVVSHKPFGVVVRLGDGSTHLLHITRVSKVRIEPDQLPSILPLGTELPVRVESHVSKGVARLGMSAIHCETVWGDWARDPVGTQRKAVEKFQQRQAEPQGKQQRKGNKEDSGEGQGLLVGWPGAAREVMQLLVAADSVQFSALLAGAASRQLLEQYCQVVATLESRVETVTGASLPWSTAAQPAESATVSTAAGSVQGSGTSAAASDSGSSSSSDGGSPGPERQRRAEELRVAELSEILNSLQTEQSQQDVQAALGRWLRCDIAHRQIMATMLSLRLKSQAVRSLLARRRSSDGESATGSAEQAAHHDAAALAAITLLPEDGLGRLDPPALLTTALRGLSDAAWLLRKEQRRQSRGDDSDGASTPQEPALLQAWLSTAGPLLASWATVRGVSVEELVSSHVLPTLHHLGWLSQLQQSNERGWQLLMDQCFGKLRRRLLTSKPLITAAGPQEGDSQHSDTQRPSVVALNQGYTLFQLALAMGFRPRPEWWAAALGQLTEEVPQIWQLSAAQESAAVDARLLNRVRAAAAQLAVAAEQ